MDAKEVVKKGYELFGKGDMEAFMEMFIWRYWCNLQLYGENFKKIFYFNKLLIELSNDRKI